MVRSGLFALHVLPNDRGWRLGLVIPKRFEGHAVRRNAIRRIWRETFRTARLAPLADESGWDLVVRLTSRPKAVGLAELKQNCRHDATVLLGELFQRLVRQRPGARCENS